MKAPRKPFVVEVKNRRRQSTRDQSIWGAIDLKAMSNQITTDEVAGTIVATAGQQPCDAGSAESADVSA